MKHTTDRAREDTSEIELTDDDILDAMAHIPGYLDITTEDFRHIYHLAHRHALVRLFSGLRAHQIMRSGVPALAPDMMLDRAARVMADASYKGLPVVDAAGRVVGMLTEADFLRRLQADSFLGLMLRLIENACELSHRCHETPVSAAMTSPVVTVGADDGFREILAAFRRHEGRSVPVVDAQGRLCGLLLRKDFLAAFAADGLP